MENENKYSILIGLVKTGKNSLWMLIPFGLAVLSSVPEEYSWIALPIGYFLKNLYENKIKK